MATQEPSYAQLTRDVVQGSPEPLSVDEIIERVNALRPITTKNPKRTIRTAIGAGASAMVVNTGDGRYGWKTRVINGSFLRYTLRESDLLMEVLQYSDELQDALCPTFYAQEQYKDESPAKVTLPDGTIVELPAEEMQYSVTFEPRRDRDEAAIAGRNQVFLEMIVKMLNRPYGAATWDITTHALARGYYKHPVLPDPLYEIWRDDMWSFQPPDEPATSAGWPK
jgi:hypothetical protein